MPECPHCHAAITVSAASCPSCGKPVEPPQTVGPTSAQKRPAAPDPALARTVMGVGSSGPGAKEPAVKPAGAPAGTPAPTVDLRSTRMGVGPSQAALDAALRPTEMGSAKDLFGTTLKDAGPPVGAAGGTTPRPIGAVATPIGVPPTTQQPAVSTSAEIEAARQIPPTAEGQILRVRQAASPPNAPNATERSADSGLRRLPASAPLRPPVLASDSLRQELRPIEPGRMVMRVLLGLGGAVLALQMFLPWGRTPRGPLFAWDRVTLLAGLDLVLFAYALLAAVVMIFLAARRTTYRARAVGAAVAGTLPLMFAAVGAGDFAFGTGPRDLLLAFTVVLLAGTLVYRANYRDSLAARVVVALGVLLGLAWLLLPVAGEVPLFARMDSLRDAELVIRVWMFALFALVLLALLAFMGSATTGGSRYWAVLLVLWIPGLRFIQALWSVSDLEDVVANLPSFHAVVMAAVYGAVAAYGFAQTLAAVTAPSPAAGVPAAGESESG